jgi:hypothetical protein
MAVDAFLDDSRYAVRALRKTPLIPGLATLCLDRASPDATRTTLAKGPRVRRFWS